MKDHQLRALVQVAGERLDPRRRAGDEPEPERMHEGAARVEEDVAQPKLLQRSYKGIGFTPEGMPLWPGPAGAGHAGARARGDPPDAAAPERM